MSGSTRAPRNIAGGAALRREVAGECKSVEWQRSGIAAGSGASAACVAEQPGPCACETCDERQAGRRIVALLSAPEASKAVVQGAPEGGSWHRQQSCERHPASERLRPHLHLSRSGPEQLRGRRKMFQPRSKVLFRGLRLGKQKNCLGFSFVGFASFRQRWERLGLDTLQPDSAA